MRGAILVFAALSAVVCSPSVRAEMTIDGVELKQPVAVTAQAQHAAIGELALTPGAAFLVAAAGAFALVGRRRTDEETG